MFTKFSLCTALVVLLSFVSETTFAQGNGPQARHILFDTTVTEPLSPFQGNALPGGTVTISNFNEVFGDNLEITVRGLERVSGDNVYGLYIISESSSEDYDSGDFDNIRILFNVDFHGSWHRFAVSNSNIFGAPNVTAFVILEEDDGLDFIPETDFVIMEGTSTLP